MHCRQVHSVMAGLRQGGGSRVQMDGVVHSAGQPQVPRVGACVHATCRSQAAMQSREACTAGRCTVSWQA